MRQEIGRNGSGLPRLPFARAQTWRKTFRRPHARCGTRHAFCNAVPEIQRLQFQENPVLGKVAEDIAFVG